MLKEWQFDVLFIVGVGGAIVLLFGPSMGLKIGDNPVAVTGVGAILTYVLTQRRALVRSESKNNTPADKEEVDDGVQ